MEEGVPYFALPPTPTPVALVELPPPTATTPPPLLGLWGGEREVLGEGVAVGEREGERLGERVRVGEVEWEEDTVGVVDTL